MTLATKADVGRAVHLMERVLRGGEPLAGEYPLVFGEGFPGRVVALGDGEAVRSACAILERELVVGDERLRAGLVGSVTTDPDWRHRGLATRVLLQAEDELRAGGCELALLWADDPRFYFARGYQPVGWEVDFGVGADAARALPDRPCRPARAEDAAAIHRLYERHRLRVARAPEETRALLGCPGMTTLVCERGGEAAAFACLGRGGDLAGTIHEWGGDADDVLALVRAHHAAASARGSALVFVMSAPGEDAVATRLAAAGAEPEAGILGLGKVLDRRALAERLARSLRGGRVESGAGAGRGLPVVVTGPRGSKALGDTQLLELLFAPRGERAAHEALERATGVDTADLPRTPYVWGLDSI